MPIERAQETEVFWPVFVFLGTIIVVIMYREQLYLSYLWRIGWTERTVPGRLLIALCILGVIVWQEKAVENGVNTFAFWLNTGRLPMRTPGPPAPLRPKNPFDYIPNRR